MVFAGLGIDEDTFREEDLLIRLELMKERIKYQVSHFQLRDELLEYFTNRTMGL